MSKMLFIFSPLLSSCNQNPRRAPFVYPSSLAVLADSFCSSPFFHLHFRFEPHHRRIPLIRPRSLPFFSWSD
ncbi:hypothetical protein V2J09_011360 [Rumex salicifolius]